VSTATLAPAASLLAALLVVSGCVERKLRIRTDPPGALVTINDEQVGVTPLEVTFLWYGDYELVLRKSGYEMLRTHYRADAPWWQYPPFDLVAETLVPTTIRDVHDLPLYTLTPEEEPPVAEVLRRATDLRSEALSPPP
jgi:hypothetical protein